MKYSELFTKTRKQSPKDEISNNAQLLIRAGFIHKEMAGVYSYLPLGLRVLRKIESIIREEMNAIGGIEMLMTTLQDPKLWQKTGRWDDNVVDNWFKTKLTNGGELGIANTHEEPLTATLTNFVSSHRELPRYIYQFQTKFRNELRAKSGLMRGREFLMKDLYSFSRSQEEHDEFYEKCAQSYLKIFSRIGIGDVTYRTTASGGSFTDGFTDEFQTVSDAGEDTIYLDTTSKRAINKEVYTNENLEKMKMNKNTLQEVKAIEVGNIFPLGTRYTQAMGLHFTDETGEKRPVIMGSYGIGLSRLIGTVVEVLCDDQGIIWPSSIAPATVHLVALDGGENQANDLYTKLVSDGIEVIYDDRNDVGAGDKLADADLMGIPLRVVTSQRTVKENILEIKNRNSKESEMVRRDEVMHKIASSI